MIKKYNSVFTGILLFLSVVCFSQVKLSKLISDGMVLQRNTKNPVAVRCGWADNPGEANSYNKEGLPAAPFRTDNW